MPDQIFETPRLTAIYDSFDGSREDLYNYLEIVKELNVNSILDVGCGTGTFASLLGQNDYKVFGLEPAFASLQVAKKKPFTKDVTWILGDSTDLSDVKVDLAVMTGNVAQVFLEDQLWEQTLINIRKSLTSKGHLVFEVRNPKQQAWLQWNRQNTYKKIDVPNVGIVEGWCEVTNVSEGLVSFCWTYIFESDGHKLTSDSTIRFRSKKDVIESLTKTEFSVKDIRDAPDRPGKEFVFIAEVKK